VIDRFVHCFSSPNWPKMAENDQSMARNIRTSLVAQVWTLLSDAQPSNCSCKIFKVERFTSLQWLQTGSRFQQPAPKTTTSTDRSKRRALQYRWIRSQWRRYKQHPQICDININIITSFDVASTWESIKSNVTRRCDSASSNIVQNHTVTPRAEAVRPKRYIQQE